MNTAELKTLTDNEKILSSLNDLKKLMATMIILSCTEKLNNLEINNPHRTNMLLQYELAIRLAETLGNKE